MTSENTHLQMICSESITHSQPLTLMTIHFNTLTYSSQCFTVLPMKTSCLNEHFLPQYTIASDSCTTDRRTT